jgi:hypothetical protein
MTERSPMTVDFGRFRSISVDFGRFRSISVDFGLREFRTHAHTLIHSYTHTRIHSHAHTRARACCLVQTRRLSEGPVLVGGRVRTLWERRETRDEIYDTGVHRVPCTIAGTGKATGHTSSGFGSQQGSQQGSQRSEVVLWTGGRW